jgi:hypothetical protein
LDVAGAQRPAVDADVIAGDRRSRVDVPVSTATISSPVDGMQFQAGDVISYSGDGTDPYHGAFKWNIDFLHARTAGRVVPRRPESWRDRPGSGPGWWSGTTLSLMAI